MNRELECFTFRTPGILVNPFRKRGELCHDSLIKICARSYAEAQGKCAEYIRFGVKLGFYKKTGVALAS